MQTYELKNEKSGKIDFQMVEIAHDPLYNYKGIHRHEYFEFILFENGGRGVQTIDFVKYPVTEKSLYIIMPNQVHLLQRKKEENGVIIQFTKEFLQTSLSPVQVDCLHSLRSNPHTQLSDSEFHRLYTAFLRLKQLFESKKAYQVYQIRHYFAYVFYQVLEILPKESDLFVENDTVYQFLYLAENDFVEKRNVAEYAVMLNVSTSKLNSDLRQITGKSALQIIHELLVVEIKRLLMVEKLTHKEISFRLQFDSQASYTRFVQKHTGYKPSDLRELLLSQHK